MPRLTNAVILVVCAALVAGCTNRSLSRTEVHKGQDFQVSKLEEIGLMGNASTYSYEVVLPDGTKIETLGVEEETAAERAKDIAIDDWIRKQGTPGRSTTIAGPPAPAPVNTTPREPTQNIDAFTAGD